MTRKRRRPIYIFLLLSLLIHVSILISVLLNKARPFPAKPAPVEVQFVTPEELAAKKTAEAAVKSRSARAKVQEQIVEQDKQVNNEIDKNTRFLSAHNQRVIQQTKAERSGKFLNTAAGGHPDEGDKHGDKNEKIITEAKAHKAREKGEMPDLKDLMPKFALEPGPKAPQNDNPGDPSQTDDYLKDVNTGMQTLLSTREFVYYSYYQRIKEALRQHWEPNVRERVKIIYRQGRTIASAKDRVTQVLVTLNPQGELLRVEVLTQSGVIDLDDAAVDAFRAASPFPNPPKGMVESDGTIKIRWDFVLEA
jgi:protein TonB